jgi:hypothetical protein
MGQDNSKPKIETGIIPVERLYHLSYVVQEKIEKIKEIEEIKNFIDLSYILEPYDQVGLIMQVIYYKLKNNGYTLKPLNIELVYSSIHDILQEFNKKGLPTSNGTINDINIVSNCYQSHLNTIYHFLNCGDILLGLIILDQEFINRVIKIDKKIVNNVIATDIVLIVGYDLDTFFIKTKWYNEILKIENRFLKNIKEIWNIKLNLTKII